MLRAEWFTGLAVALIVPALVCPPLLRAPNRLWGKLAHALGWVNSRVLLSALFIGIVTPLGLALRATGRDPLHRRKPVGSGWTAYPARQRDPKHYERMY